MKKKGFKIIFWLPRVLCIVFILFLMMFSLDVFDEGYGIGETILALLIHNIPAFILLAVLILAWRWEWIGTIVFDAVAVFYVYWSWGNFPGLSYLVLAAPLVLIGFLFMLSWFFKAETSPDLDQPDKKQKKSLLYLTALVSIILLAGLVYAWNANTGADLIPARTSILQPEDEALVERQMQVMGGFTQADSSKDLWLVVQQFDSLQYHPQPGPLMKAPLRPRWYSTAFFGEPDDPPGKKYHIYLFAATETASMEFTEYAKTGTETGKWPGIKSLPAGLTPLDTVTVARK
jgi:hypothetical protein